MPAASMNTNIMGAQTPADSRNSPSCSIVRHCLAGEKRNRKIAAAMNRIGIDTFITALFLFSSVCMTTPYRDSYRISVGGGLTLGQNLLPHLSGTVPGSGISCRIPGWRRIADLSVSSLIEHPWMRGSSPSIMAGATGRPEAMYSAVRYSSLAFGSVSILRLEALRFFKKTAQQALFLRPGFGQPQLATDAGL